MFLLGRDCYLLLVIDAAFFFGWALRGGREHEHETGERENNGRAKRKQTVFIFFISFIFQRGETARHRFNQGGRFFSRGQTTRSNNPAAQRVPALTAHKFAAARARAHRVQSDRTYDTST